MNPPVMNLGKMTQLTQHRWSQLVAMILVCGDPPFSRQITLRLKVPFSNRYHWNTSIGSPWSTVQCNHVKLMLMTISVYWCPNFDVGNILRILVTLAYVENRQQQTNFVINMHSLWNFSLNPFYLIYLYRYLHHGSNVFQIHLHPFISH